MCVHVCESRSKKLLYNLALSFVPLSLLEETDTHGLEDRNWQENMLNVIT